LRQSKPADELPDAQLPLTSQQLEYPQADGVSEPAKVLRDEIRLERGGGKPKRRRVERSAHAHWIFGRDDQVGCPVFSPIERAERARLAT
jgi:hypothetical protein